MVIGYCIIQFLLIRELQSFLKYGYLLSVSVVGIAYFTCRNIHYIFEVYKGSITTNLSYFWYYQSFLPVFITGPINRYQDFTCEIERRHFFSQQFSSALERVIYGYAKVVIIGNYLINVKLLNILQTIEQDTILYSWLKSAIDWGYLYIQFSGWSDIAIGFSLLMGIKIKENFNYPYKALNIIDFWQRWHISLSQWCKDYVYIPFLAITRKPFYSVIAAMLAMGIWHELSLYYVLWGIYHASGIAVCRVFQQQKNKYIITIRNMRYWFVISWLLTMNFIISGTLVISFINKWIHQYV
jgi:alginate O-acetyltransferase complex protein AlgI